MPERESEKHDPDRTDTIPMSPEPGNSGKGADEQDISRTITVGEKGEPVTLTLEEKRGQLARITKAYLDGSLKEDDFFEEARRLKRTPEKR